MSIFTHAPATWTNDLPVPNAATFNLEIKEKMTDIDTNILLKSKVITAARDMASVQWTVSYTGVGFRPTSIMTTGVISGSAVWCKGSIDSVGGAFCLSTEQSGNLYMREYAIWLQIGTALQRASFSSYDTDGFTLLWEKAESPTGTVALKFLCFR